MASSAGYGETGARGPQAFARVRRAALLLTPRFGRPVSALPFSICLVPLRRYRRHLGLRDASSAPTMSSGGPALVTHGRGRAVPSVSRARGQAMKHVACVLILLSVIIASSMAQVPAGDRAGLSLAIRQGNRSASGRSSRSSLRWSRRLTTADSPRSTSRQRPAGWTSSNTSCSAARTSRHERPAGRHRCSRRCRWRAPRRSTTCSARAPDWRPGTTAGSRFSSSRCPGSGQPWPI